MRDDLTKYVIVLLGNVYFLIDYVPLIMPLYAVWIHFLYIQIRLSISLSNLEY